VSKIRGTYRRILIYFCKINVLGPCAVSQISLIIDPDRWFGIKWFFVCGHCFWASYLPVILIVNPLKNWIYRGPGFLYLNEINNGIIYPFKENILFKINLFFPVEKEHTEIFGRSENYNKKRRSGGIHLFIQISPSEFLRLFFGTSLRFQIRGYESSSDVYEDLISVRFLNISANMFS
jgi:hypothetical protein